MVTIDINTVSSVVMNLELGKPLGFDEVTAEHLKYAHPGVLSIFNLLFNRVLKEELVPDDFAWGLTVPIPKDRNRSLNLSYEDIRGITNKSSNF